MTVCNMTIEGGARAGMIAPDETTFSYLEGRPFVPRGKAFQEAVERWKLLKTDEGAKFDTTIELHANELAPQVTWGTNPGMVTSINGRVPDPHDFKDLNDQKATESALKYMGLKPGTPIVDIPVDRVFIGSCTNSRLDDLRAAAQLVAGKHVAKNIKQALIVPGSRGIKAQAEKEGLDKVFTQAGFEWRDAGCSMCIGMNAESCRRTSAAPAPRIAISKAAKAATAARISSARSWRPQRPSQVIRRRPRIRRSPRRVATFLRRLGSAFRGGRPTLPIL